MKSILALTLAALAMVPGSAAAQLVPGNTLPEALKGIPQASSVCTREGFAPQAGVVVREPEPDLGCALAAEPVQGLLRQEGSVAIDLRAREAFDDYHIDGAVNATLADLLGKPYWRGKKVVLAGSGKGEREVYAACARLKQAGYKNVAVLRGGMMAWLAAGKPVRGRAPSAQQLAYLSAAELWHEAQFPDNQVVVHKGHDGLLKDIPFSVSIPELDAAAIRRATEQRRRAVKTPAAAVVLVAGPGTSAQQLQQLQAALAPLPLLVYTDTREAFSRQLASQRAIWLAHARGPKLPACGQ